MPNGRTSARPMAKLTQSWLEKMCMGAAGRLSPMISSYLEHMREYMKYISMPSTSPYVLTFVPHAMTSNDHIPMYSPIYITI